jgi:hypothetical protein
VAIEVAIALAVSWKPLVKSKISAVSTTTTTIADTSMTVPFRRQRNTPVDAGVVAAVQNAANPHVRHSLDRATGV